MKYCDKKQGVPLVTIGMPVYNGGEYIHDAISSLLKQTFTSFELIISDNASSDQTEFICRKFTESDERIVYFRQKENIGAAANFQFVLEHSHTAIFMWAAHDDKWEENYLREAVALLCDKGVDFIFPTFSVQSIKLGIGKKFSPEIFRFIESTERKERVLQFLALHHDSHKCNIVYSLFRTDFIRAALKIEDIGNDGALGAVILGLGRGKMLCGAMFKKRYPRLWPGALSILFAWLSSNTSSDFELAKEVALNKLRVLFPEYIDEIEAIFDRYHLHKCDKFHRICSVAHSQINR